MLHRLLATFFLLLLSACPELPAQSNSGDDPRVQELYGQAKPAKWRAVPAPASSRSEETLRMAPRLGPAYNNLGALYFRQREYQKAARILEAGVKISPAMPSASEVGR